jgi:hypothetical protein
MKPNYVAKKAGGHYAWKKLGWSKLLILPVVFAWAPMAIKAKSEKVEFYDDYIVEKKGVFRKTERHGILLSQPLLVYKERFLFLGFPLRRKQSTSLTDKVVSNGGVLCKKKTNKR